MTSFRRAKPFPVPLNASPFDSGSVNPSRDPVSPVSLLDSVIDALPDGLVIVAESGVLLYSNPAAHRIFGFVLPQGSADWMASMRWFLPDSKSPFPPDQLPTAAALRGEACEGAEIFVRSDGRPHGAWIRVSASPYRNSAGILIGAIATFRDITDARDSTGILERLSAAVETTSDSVVMTDVDGTIVYVNPAFEQTTGYSRGEAIGATPRILKSGIHDRQYYERMWSTIRSGQVFRGVLINRRKDGAPFYAEQTVTPVVGRDGSILNYVSLMRDITDRRRAVQQETELRLARDVQQNLYPRTSAAIRGYDIAGLMHPAATQMMSGDYFDVFPIADGSTGIALGDVCGHGISAAMIMAQTRAYVRAFAQTHSDMNAVMAMVNDSLVSDLAPENFVTLILAAFDARTDTFTYSNAGHLSGYVLKRSGEIRETLASNGMALGFFAGRSYSPKAPVRLGPDETLLLFSDGIVEAESPAGDEFGDTRAVATVAARLHLPAAEIAEGLYDAARAFAHHGPQRDDMTVFVCKATGERAQA